MLGLKAKQAMVPLHVRFDAAHADLFEHVRSKVGSVTVIKKKSRQERNGRTTTSMLIAAPEGTKADFDGFGIFESVASLPNDAAQRWKRLKKSIQGQVRRITL